MSYVVIRVEAHKANMQQTPSILAATPVFASVMAAHALDQNLGGLLQVQGVGLVHHWATPWLEQLPNSKGWVQRYAMDRRGATLFGHAETARATVLKPVSAQPQVLCDIAWTWILQTGQDAQGREDRIAQELGLMRWAGGTLRKPRVAVTQTFEDALRATSPGYWVDDVTTNVLGDRPADMHPITHALHRLRTCKDHGWVAPSTLGYALLEAPTAREGARDAKAHAFCEPMLGVIRFLPLRALRNQPENARFWRFGWKADQCLVSNHDALDASCHVPEVG